MDFSPDSKVLAYRWESKIRMLDLETLEPHREIDNDTNSITIRYSPNGRFLLVGCCRKDLINIYDLEKDSSVSKIYSGRARVHQRVQVSKDAHFHHSIEPEWHPEGTHVLTRWNKEAVVRIVGPEGEV